MIHYYCWIPLVFVDQPGQLSNWPIGSSHRLGPNCSGPHLGGPDARGGRLWRIYGEQGSWSLHRMIGWDKSSKHQSKTLMVFAVLDGLMGKQARNRVVRQGCVWDILIAMKFVPSDQVSLFFNPWRSLWYKYICLCMKKIIYLGFHHQLKKHQLIITIDL